MSCRTTVPLLEPFADGELSPERVLEVEQHLAECRLCVERVRLGKAMRNSLRQVTRSNAEPSELFRQRLSAALEATRQREWDAQVEANRQERQRMLPWRTILPIAAAATFMLVRTATIRPEAESKARHPHPPQTAAAMAEQTIEDLLQYHTQGKPIYPSADLNLVHDMEQEVGVPVRLPHLTQYGARWEGGSVVPVRNLRTTASFRYKVAGHPVTIYVYDPKRLPIAEQLQNRRWVGDAQVYVAARGKYSIGAAEHNRVGYAVATDLSDSETAELVAAVH